MFNASNYKEEALLNNASQAADGLLRAAPPVTVSAASFMGLGLEEWMYMATIAYTLLQGSFLIYRWRKSHKENKGDK